MIYTDFEELISKKMKSVCENYHDPSHDFSHIKRVVSIATKLGKIESADLNIIIPASYMHDIVSFEKNDPRRKQASTFSADAAIIFLKSINYPENYHEDIAHAISSHSFSAEIPPDTIEAKIVQDADRLDALGAIGIARMFCISGRLGTCFYNINDPLALNRVLNDKEYSFDHFYTKILKLQDSLNTKSAQEIGKVRTDFIKNYIKQFQEEINLP